MHQRLGSKELKFISYEMQFSYQLSTNENQPVKGTMIHFKSTFIFKMKPLASVFNLVVHLFISWSKAKRFPTGTISMHVAMK